MFKMIFRPRANIELKVHINLMEVKEVKDDTFTASQGEALIYQYFPQLTAEQRERFAG